MLQALYPLPAIESHYTLEKNYTDHRADFNMALNSSIHSLPTRKRNQILQPVTHHWRNELPCRVTMTETSLSQSSIMMIMTPPPPPPPPPPTTTSTTGVTCRREPKQWCKDYITRCTTHRTHFKVSRISKEEKRCRRKGTAHELVRMNHGQAFSLQRVNLSARIQTRGSPRTCVGQPAQGQLSLRVLLTPPVNYHSINAPQSFLYKSRDGQNHKEGEIKLIQGVV